MIFETCIEKARYTNKGYTLLRTIPRDIGRRNQFCRGDGVVEDSLLK